MERQSNFIDVCDKSLQNLKYIDEDVENLKNYILFVAIKQQQNQTIENIPAINSPELDKQIVLHEETYIKVGNMVDNGVIYKNIDPIIQNQYEKSLPIIPKSKNVYLQNFLVYLRQKLLELCYIKIGDKNKTKLKKLRKLKKELENVMSDNRILVDNTEQTVDKILYGLIKERTNLFIQFRDKYSGEEKKEVIDYYEAATKEQLVTMEIFNMNLNMKEVRIILKLKRQQEDKKLARERK